MRLATLDADWLEPDLCSFNLSWASGVVEVQDEKILISFPSTPR